MASATEDPILIASDDEGSDSDDVVLIKEEIEVDNDDVIFLSETKAPTPPPGPESHGSESSSAGVGAGDGMGIGETGPLNLSTSSLMSRTPTDDLCNFILRPLDLSAKADSHDQSGSSDTCKNADNSWKDDNLNDIFSSLLFDTDVYNNTHLRLPVDISNSADVNVSDAKVQGPGLSATSCDTSSVSDSASKSVADILSDPNTTNSVSKAIVVDISDQNTTTGNSATTASIIDISDLNTTDSTTKATRVDISDLNTTDSTTKATKVDISDQNTTDSSKNSTLISPVIDINNEKTATNTKGNADITYKVDQNTKQTPKDTHFPDNSKVFNVDSILKVGSTGSTQWDSETMLGKDNIVRKIKQSLYDIDVSQPVPSHIRQSGLQQKSVSQSTNSIFPQTGSQTITQVNPQNQIQSGSQSTSMTGSLSSQGLPGGSQLNVTSHTTDLSNQSAFKVINWLNGSASSSQFKRSKSYNDQSYMYNPLTLPKSEKESYMRSFSSSSLNSWSATDYNKRKSNTLLPIPSTVPSNSMDTSASASDGTYQLPPKKQKRCFVELKCTSCRIDISGDKSCKCPNGHAICGQCLEEKVKKILTGKAKESIRCLTESCDSFYAISELKLCLPSMVVEILEERLDQDYVNYFSSINLKNVMDELNGEGSSGMDVDGEGECPGPSGSGQGVTPKKPADIDPDYPQNWDPMNEKSNYEMFTLDVNSEEYNQIMPQFFASMINHNVEVVRIQRIQNPILWKFFSVKKKEMLLDNEGFGPVNEQLLYHGTDNSAVDAICKKGFDWRVCGKNGTLYGQGSYFAVHASYSHQYTDIKASRHPNIIHFGSSSILHSSLPMPGSSSQTAFPFPPNPGSSVMNLSNSGQGSSPASQVLVIPSLTPTYKILPKPVTVRSMSGHPSWSNNPLDEFLGPRPKQTTQMFVARVLVGKFSGGSCKLRKPPALDPNSDPYGKCYDSCVDNIHMPKLFVIFDSAQAYPEYLIEYTYD